MSREWYLFFQALFVRAGGSSGPSTNDVSASLFEDAGSSETNAVLFAVDQALSQHPYPVPLTPPNDVAPPQETTTVDTLQTEVCELREALARTLKEIEALKQTILS